MEYAIDSGFEPVGTKYRYDRLKEVKRVIYKRCFEESRKFFDMYAEHTREALDEEMKHLIFCHRFLIPYEETERTRNRWKRHDKIFEIQEKSADGVCCRIESLIIKNRYYDYWTDLFRARRENREIKDFDIDPRLMIMLCQSRERVGKRNAERQAKLDSSEKLERNFNCKNPQKFWKTSVQKESDQKSPAAVEPMMNSSNNLVFRPKVEGTIAEEVQNQSAQKTMDSVCSDAQNLNDGAPEKKNEQTGKEGKAPAQSSQQGSSSQSTPRAERAERSRNYTYMQNLQRQREEENAQKSLGFFFDFSEYLDGPNGLEGLLEPHESNFA
ncbi:Protein CBG17843 [Caenorhabditis briggsae]|uniref:Protein CBG17843 n=1 Tax=Caenorhabditis briggsae TaxID=6238 RepID=A8XRW5_CAEBR|nr:Protein CBG17843 [Caenorhabditis briggsae]CAP35391.2 Protein CBG17843 [Caenorhabditis briggsae]